MAKDVSGVFTFRASVDDLLYEDLMDGKSRALEIRLALDAARVLDTPTLNVRFPVSEQKITFSEAPTPVPVRVKEAIPETTVGDSILVADGFKQETVQMTRKEAGGLIAQARAAYPDLFEEEEGGPEEIEVEVNRSAETGQFVSDEEAEENPKTTVTEVVEKRGPGRPRAS